MIDQMHHHDLVKSYYTLVMLYQNIPEKFRSFHNIEVQQIQEYFL